MSIFKVLEANIRNSYHNYSRFISTLTGDKLRGTEFMFFSLTQFFKDFEIDDIEDGIIDSCYRGESYDFGIDAIYITSSNEFIEDSNQLEEFNDDSKFQIHLFQFKRGTGITQADILKFQSGLKRILIDENVTDHDNLHLYNRMLILNKVKNNLYLQFSSDNINVICHFVFGGIKQNILSQKIIVDEFDKITSILQTGGFSNSEINITDCQGLINLKTKGDEIVDIVKYEKTFKYITKSGQSSKLNGYINIINGKEIAELVRKYQTSIFESNIRDFYKRSDLNDKITETSSSESEAKYFWSYNNGITMTCRKVEELPNDNYRLYDLQIVNGCQTSNSIYTALKNKDRCDELQKKIDDGKELSKKENDEFIQKSQMQFNEDTSLLVKIIETDDEDLIYRITETTNSQTPIKVFSLKANDDIQVLIEKFLETKDIWYERRINYYKNKGKKNIYSIQKLFQLYTSQILFKPSQVKTSPKSMFINTYDSVFPQPSVKIFNFNLYYIPIIVDIAINKRIREIQRQQLITDDFTRTILSYGKLHLGCFILSSILKNKYKEKGIIEKEEIIINELNNNINDHMNDAIIQFEKILKSFSGTRKESIPQSVRKIDLDQKIVRFVKNRK